MDFKKYYTIAVYGDGLFWTKGLVRDTVIVRAVSKEAVKRTRQYKFVKKYVEDNENNIKILEGIC